MSVLNTPERSPTPAPQRVAKLLKENARATFVQLAATYARNARTFWQNDSATPSEIAAALGPDAAELFQLHWAIGQMLQTVKPGSIDAALAVVGQFTVNEDGTVTVQE